MRSPSGQLVGIGVVVPHFRPRIAQLAFLHVRAQVRATGIGSRLSDTLEQIARTAGDSDIVVSATPSENTVRFYLGRGFQPMAEPLAELFALEPEDIHMRKMLRAAASPRRPIAPRQAVPSGKCLIHSAGGSSGVARRVRGAQRTGP